MYYLEEFFWFYCSIFSIKVRMICRVTSAISVKLSSHQDFLSWQNTVTRRRRRTKKRRRKTAQINVQIVQNCKYVEGLLISKRLKWDQNLQFTPLSESTSSQHFGWKSPLPGPRPFVRSSVRRIVLPRVRPTNQSIINHQSINETNI